MEGFWGFGVCHRLHCDDCRAISYFGLSPNESKTCPFSATLRSTASSIGVEYLFLSTASDTRSPAH